MSRNRKSLSAPLRRKIIQRDKGVCRVCKMHSIDEIHHILPVFLGGTDEENNLIGLCHLCHWYSPDDPKEFYKYKKEGGMLWKWMDISFNANKFTNTLFGLRKLILKGYKTYKLLDN